MSGLRTAVDMKWADNDGLCLHRRRIERNHRLFTAVDSVTHSFPVSVRTTDDNVNKEPAQLLLSAVSRMA